MGKRSEICMNWLPLLCRQLALGLCVLPLLARAQAADQCLGVMTDSQIIKSTFNESQSIGEAIRAVNRSQESGDGRYTNLFFLSSPAALVFSTGAMLTSAHGILLILFAHRETEEKYAVAYRHAITSSTTATQLFLANVRALENALGQASSTKLTSEEKLLHRQLQAAVTRFKERYSSCRMVLPP